MSCKCHSKPANFRAEWCKYCDTCLNANDPRSVSKHDSTCIKRKEAMEEMTRTLFEDPEMVELMKRLSYED